MQRRLFGERAVGVRGYLACAVVIGAASALAAGIGLAAFAGLACRQLEQAALAEPAVIICSSVVVVRQLRIVMLL